MALIEKLTAIADALRSKTGGTAKLTLDEMPTVIGNISTLPQNARYMGDWMMGTSYIKNDIVASGGHLWYARKDDTDPVNEPTSGGGVWVMLC